MNQIEQNQTEYSYVPNKVVDNQQVQYTNSSIQAQIPVENKNRRKTIIFCCILFLFVIIISVICVILARSSDVVQKALKTVNLGWKRVDFIGDQDCSTVTVHREKIFVGCEEGLYKSFDNGYSWIEDDYFKEVSSVLNFPKRIRFSEDGNNIYIATLMSGIYKSENAGESWEHLNVECGVVDFDITKDGQTIYSLCGMKASLYKSVDEGVNWEKLQEYIPDDFVHISLEDEERVYFSFSETFLTINGGETINTQGGKFPNPIAFEDVYFFKDENNILVGGMGGVFFSSDGGVNWSEFQNIEADFEYSDLEYISTNHLESVLEYVDYSDISWISTIAVNPNDERIILFGAMSDGIRITFDSGEKLYNISKGLSVQKSGSQSFDIISDSAWGNDGDKAYVTSSHGLYMIDFKEK